MQPGARWTLPKASAGLGRVLYLFQGAGLSIAGETVRPTSAIQLRSGREVAMVNGEQTSELLMLQARPIGEPVAHRGPFVMNTPEELSQAFSDYRRTHFGGWPWPRDAPVHPPQRARFATHADGHTEEPG